MTSFKTRPSARRVQPDWSDLSVYFCASDRVGGALPLASDDPACQRKRADFGTGGLHQLSG